eukprot:2088438-Ditylum_brightwellii.AAC.1
MSLQAEWQYLQRMVPGVGALMGPIEDALCQDFFSILFRELDPGEVEEKGRCGATASSGAGWGSRTPWRQQNTFTKP